MMQPVQPQPRVLLGLLVSGLGVLAGLGSAQTPMAGLLLSVSKPPVSLLPTDPPQGHIYSSPPGLAWAEPFFDTAGTQASLEYLAFDRLGNGYVTFSSPDQTAPGGLMILENLASRRGGTFKPGRDRLISGREVGLTEPKDLILLEALGLAVVADFGSADLRVLDTLRSGDVAPVFTTSDLGVSRGGEPRRPWGVTYDEPSDRLFVSTTDGVLLVYDAYLEKQGEGGPDHVITPTLNGRRVAHNLHELVYLPAQDAVLVADVGTATTSDQPGFDSDGALLVIEGASRADGPTPVSLRLQGPSSLLGNPVALARHGESIFVAESARDLVLRFDGLLGLRGEVDLPPDAAVTVTKPESLALTPPDSR